MLRRVLADTLARATQVRKERGGGDEMRPRARAALGAPPSLSRPPRRAHAPHTHPFCLTPLHTQAHRLESSAAAAASRAYATQQVRGEKKR